MSEAEMDGYISDEEVCSLLESSLQEIEEELGPDATSTYVLRERKRLSLGGGREGGGEGEETLEELRAKVVQLQGYVRDLVEHYTELMEAFVKLKERRGDTFAVGGGGEGEGGEGEVWSQLRQLQMENDQLRASLGGEGEGERERVHEQMACILRVIDNGVQTGNLKLSELSKYSSELPFPAQDLPLGTEAVREEEEGGRGEEEEVRGELERVRGECEALAEQLMEAEGKMEVALQQRDQLEEELQSLQGEGAELKSEVASMTCQLTEARQKGAELSQALTTRQQAMEIFQETARRDLEHRDGELERLRSEVKTLEEMRCALGAECEEGRGRVGGMEEELSKAYDEIQLLQKQVEELVPEAEEEGKRVGLLEQDLQGCREEILALRQEKEDMERNLEDRISELQAGIAAAVQGQREAEQQSSDYRLQLDTLRDTQASMQDEVHRCRQLLLEKEQQLSKMMTSLHVTAAQIAGLRCQGDETQPPMPEDGAWPSGGGGDLVKVVEREVEEVRLEWEESRAAVCRHQTTITDMTVKLEQLQTEIAAREKQVTELEKLVSETQLNQEESEASLRETEQHVRVLEREMETVRVERERVQRELAAASGNKEETERILTEELERRESSLQRLHSENHSLQDQLSSVSVEIAVMEAARVALQNEFDQLVAELETSQATVDSLEGRVREEGERRERELSRCANVIRDLQNQLRTAEERWSNSQQESQAHHTEVEQLSGKQLQLREEVRERERIIQQLQEETASLAEQHQEAMREVDRHRSTTSSLQADLLTSQSRCDTLNQEVVAGAGCLRETQTQLVATEEERDDLREQLQNLRAQVGELQALVEDGEQRVREVEEEARQREGEARGEVERGRREGERARGEGDRLVREQDAELQRRQASLSELSLEKERLEVKIASQNGAMGSLQAEVAVLQSSMTESESKTRSLEALLSESRDHSQRLEAELTTAEEKQLALEQSRAVLESVGAERLTSITSLQAEVEVGRVREGQVREMREKLSTLERLLHSLQDELESAQQENRQLVEACTSAESLTTQTETQLVAEKRGREEERREREEKLWELTRQLQALEELQTQTQAKLEVTREESGSLRAEVDARGQKERHWSSELTHLTSELQLSRDKIGRLEREEAGLKAELARVTQLLEHAQRELVGSRAEEELADRQAQEGRERVAGLEAELREARREAAALRGQLAAMEESHDHLRHRLGLMEEEYDGLQQSALQAEAQLKNTRVNLEDRKVFCQQLQEECESMNEQVGGWAERQRSNTELLLQRISELEAELQSLKTSHHKLQARYESIVKSNRDLQDQLTTKTQELEASGSSSSLLASSVTRITATLDLDLSQLAAGTNSSAGHASAIASVPLQFNSQYCSTMEEGLSKMDDPGGVTVGDRTADEELDKEFWIRRAGELSVQLQHSSDYWSQKVRELSIQLEKQQQFPHRHNEFSD